MNAKKTKREQTLQARLTEIARFIESRAEEKLTLADLAKWANLSPGYFQKAFKALFGVSPKAYQDAVRLNTLKNSIRTSANITDAIYTAGFGSTSRVYGEKSREMGMNPMQYRKGGDGESISFAYGKTPLGLLLMATSDKGLCFAQFGNTKQELKEQLTKEFPNAQLSISKNEQSPDLHAWLEALNAHLSHGYPSPDLPLDLRGTAFQIQVWNFLKKIPAGEPISYSELAKGMNKPKAIRAAASACAANKIAVLIPCHRVLRGDGNLGGYRWGLERKQALLEKEKTP